MNIDLQLSSRIKNSAKFFASVVCVASALAASSSEATLVLASYDFDDDLQSDTPDSAFGTTVVGDWTPNIVGTNTIGGLSGSNDNFFVRSNDGTPNSTNPTNSAMAYSSFTITFSGLAATEVVNLENVSYDHFATGNNGSTGFFSRVYTDLTGLTGTGDAVANQSQFNNNTGGSPSESLTGQSALQGLGNGDSVTFYLYYGDTTNTHGHIHRIDNFTVTGAVVAIPEASQVLAFSLVGLVLSAKRANKRR